MTERYACSPSEFARMDTTQLRENFLVEGLMKHDEVNFIYTHFDRMVIGGAVPVSQPLVLGNYTPLKTSFFLERREMGIINIGGAGTIEAGGQSHALEKLDCVYLGRGTDKVSFSSIDPASPARFYILSAPAHQSFPIRTMKSADASPAAMGSPETSNERTIYKYIHEDGIRSCQLVMGLTILKKGSVWNTMPAHVHGRRMEAYLYFDLDLQHRVFHLMGTASETRHMVISNEDAVISAPWSIHSGCGTSNYSFIWGMAGENQAFADMDAIPITQLK